MRLVVCGDVSTAWTMITMPAPTTATLGAINVMPARASRQVRRGSWDRRTLWQFSWREAQLDQTDQRHEQIEDEPEQVGRAARAIGVGWVEQQQGGPRVRHKQRQDG